MVYVGMIFQYDSTQEMGSIMYSDGVMREFNASNWIDTLNVPTVGQKVSCENTPNRMKVKLANQDEDITISPEELIINENESLTISEELSTLDEYVDYYTKKGFKLVKRPKVNQGDTVTLRMFTENDHCEVIIKNNGSELSVTESINGQTTTLR